VASVFKSTSEIVQEACDEFKSITQVTLSPGQIDNPHVIKMYTYAGPLSAFYSELQRTANDIFPVTASTLALRKHLKTRLLEDQIQPQKSHGKIVFSGSNGSFIPLYTQVKRVKDGAIYQTIQEATIGSAGFVSVFCESIETGTDKNLDSTGEPFVLSTPITGVSNSCSSETLFLDGRDLETPSEMLARIMAHDQDDNTGGNATAYETWAKEASNEVVTAKTIRRPRGVDSVDTYITSGTTDIQSAVENGLPVNRLPSQTLINTVQAYILALNPVTDDHITKAPIELSKDLIFKYSLYEESVAMRSYCDGVIRKIIQVYLYKARPEDTLTPSAIERLVDQSIGNLIKERKCGDLDSSTSYYIVPSVNILTPGTITIQAF